ncbi:MAG: O-antigen ligase family protein [Planctomycetaceae bacterium]|nr:O-antigen ligase family protein [Planctomycetaceae bacterium]
MANARLLPLACYLLLPALAVHVAMVPVAPDATPLYPAGSVGDIRSWWKSVLLVGIAAWMILFTVARLLTGWRPKHRAWGVGVAAAALAVFVSTWLSPYPETALIGYTTLYEGAFALWAYLVGAWFTAEMADTDRARRVLLRLLGGLTLFEAAHGIAEACGWHLWQTDFGRRLMGAGDQTVTYQFAESRLAYGTVFQPNHYGMFMAMLGALSLGMLFQESRRGWRFFWGIAYGGAVVATVCSQSRAGILTLAAVSLAYALCRTVRSRSRGGTPRQSLRGLSWGVLVVVGVPLVLLTLSGPRRAMVRVVERLAGRTASGDPVAVWAVGVEDGRIRIRLADTVVTVGKDREGTWRAEAAEGSESLPVSATSDKGVTYTVPGLEDGFLSENENGMVTLTVPGATLRFYSLGQRLWAVDRASGRLTEHVALSRYEPSGREGLFSYRGYIWARALETFAERPWFGHGPGTLALAFPNDDLLNKERFSFGQNEDKGHGVWATFLVETGLVGFLFMLLPVVLAVRRAVRSRNELRAPVLLGIIAYCICALTNDSTVGVTPIFSALVGLLVATTWTDSSQTVRTGL